jgi:hypothetical protein
MPFKSQAQRRKFAQLLVEGKITPEVYEEWKSGDGWEEVAGASEGTQGIEGREEESCGQGTEVSCPSRAQDSVSKQNGALIDQQPAGCN